MSDLAQILKTNFAWLGEDKFSGPLSYEADSENPSMIIIHGVIGLGGMAIEARAFQKMLEAYEAKN